MTEEPEYVLTVRGLPWGGVPAAVRLRRAMKCLLRSFGLRVVAMAEVRAAEAVTSTDRSAPQQPDSRGRRDV